MNKRIVVGISGASGAAYARRLLQLLLASPVEVHLVVSPLGQRLLHEEVGLERLDRPGVAQLLGLPQEPANLVLHNHRDVGASIASGSFLHDGMVIVPCSSNTLSAVANGSAANLLHRAAAVSLKERRRLVLVHRETPLSLVEIRNMQAATEAGAIVCPANPGFYMRPQSLEELVDFMAGRVLDLLGLQHHLKVRWGQTPGNQP